MNLKKTKNFIPINVFEIKINPISSLLLPKIPYYLVYKGLFPNILKTFKSHNEIQKMIKYNILIDIAIAFLFL